MKKPTGIPTRPLQCRIASIILHAIMTDVLTVYEGIAIREALKGLKKLPSKGSPLK